jgi:hypothetical protein
MKVIVAQPCTRLGVHACMRFPFGWTIVFVVAGCLTAISLSSTASAACTPKVSAPAQGLQGHVLPIAYVACAKGSHRFQLIYLSGSTVERERGANADHRTVKVKTTGKHTYEWELGAISRARYRVTMTTPSGKHVRSRHTVLIVCSPERKTDPNFDFHCSAPPAQ